MSPDGPGAAVEPALMERLGLKLGDRFAIGDASFVARAILTKEPDRLGRGFALGPSVIVARPALERSGLIAADSLFGETVRVAFPDARDPGAAIKDLQRRFSGAGVDFRGRNEAAAGLGRLIDQLEYVLGFIGLSSLIAGGLGVSTAVSSYLDSRKLSIAVLKALGARAATVRDVYLLQVAVLAGLGIGIGLAIGGGRAPGPGRGGEGSAAHSGPLRPLPGAARQGRPVRRACGRGLLAHAPGPASARRHPPPSFAAS